MKEVAELHIAPISVSILFFLFAFFQFLRVAPDEFARFTFDVDHVGLFMP